MSSQGLGVRVNSMDNHIGDGDSSPKKVGQMGPSEENKGGIEIRGWKSGDLLGICAIWCKCFPFGHLVTRVMGLRVEGIWGEEVSSRRQANI